MLDLQSTLARFTHSVEVAIASLADIVGGISSTILEHVAVSWLSSWNRVVEVYGLVNRLVHVNCWGHVELFLAH